MKKHEVAEKMKKDIFKSRYGDHGMMQFSGPNAEKNKRKDIKYNYKKEFVESKQKGRQSLNSVGKKMDNLSMEGKNEQEKN